MITFIVFIEIIIVIIIVVIMMCSLKKEGTPMWIVFLGKNHTNIQ